MRGTGVWFYCQNDVTGRHQITSANGDVYQPVDTDRVEPGACYRPYAA